MAHSREKNIPSVWLFCPSVSHQITPHFVHRRTSASITTSLWTRPSKWNRFRTSRSLRDTSCGVREMVGMREREADRERRSMTDARAMIDSMEHRRTGHGVLLCLNTISGKAQLHFALQQLHSLGVTSCRPPTRICICRIVEEQNIAN